jgi:hypothetical protein
MADANAAVEQGWACERIVRSILFNRRRGKRRLDSKKVLLFAAPWRIHP